MSKAIGTRNDAIQLLEKISGGPLTLGKAIKSIRQGEGWNQIECAKMLGISKSHLCDIEKDRKSLSPERAARWARTLGYPESVFIRLALQSKLDTAELKY